jgi:hypothetical protein
MKLVTAKFKSGGQHEKHVVATWNVGNRLSAFAYRHRETEKNLCRGVQFIVIVFSPQIPNSLTLSPQSFTSLHLLLL